MHGFLDSEVGYTEHLASGEGPVAARGLVPVTLDSPRALDQEVVVLRSEERNAVPKVRHKLFVEGLGAVVQALCEGVGSRVVPGLRQLRSAESPSDGGRCAGCEDGELKDVLVGLVGQSVAEFLRVDRAVLVVSHRLIDVGEEGIRQQETVNVDDPLCVLDVLAHNLVAGSVVGCGRFPGNGELSRFRLLSLIAQSIGLYLHPFDSAEKIVRGIF